MHFPQIVSEMLVHVEDKALPMASPMPFIRFCIHSNRVHLRYRLHAEDLPDIERTGQGEDQRTEKDGRSRPFKLPVLSV